MATSTPDGGTPTSPLPPFRLAPVFSERVWGRPNLRPWYAETGTDQPVGEAWLTGPACLIETGPLAGRTLAAAVQDFSPEILNPTAVPEFPLLVKLLFPNDKLSVQVHPDDEQARAIGQSRGKTECWYVLEAAPGADRSARPQARRHRGAARRLAQPTTPWSLSSSRSPSPSAT